MPIQLLWGNDLNAQNTFIQKLIDKEVSKEWKEINVTNLNGDHDEEVNKAFDEVLTPVSYTHLRAPRDRTRSRMPSSA